MTATLPLIRAAGIVPLVSWMRREGRDPGPLLRRLRLPETPETDPGRLVPFVAVAHFVRDLARAEGPDLPLRAITDQSASELAELSAIVLRSATPRDSFQRLMVAFSRMNSHVAYAFHAFPGGATLRHRYVVPLDAETLHFAHQTVLALIRATLGWVDPPGPRLIRVEITPHPKLGLEHLRPHLDCEVSPSDSGLLVIAMPEAALDRPFARTNRAKLPEVKEWHAARSDGTLKSSIMTVLPGLMEHGQPSLREVAELACMSSRTLQRRLRSEGVTLSELVDAMRRDRALARLTGSQDRIGDIALEVGYADIAGLSRTVRRWTSVPPRRLRTP